MKVSGVEIIPINIPSRKVLTLSRYGRLGEGRPFEFVLARVHTDEGITGVGESPPLPPLSPESQPIIVDVLKNWIVPHILGMDPFETELIWEKMDFFAPTYPMAKAAIDIALWDIKGKSLNQAVSRLMGGSSVKRFPNVALIGIRPPNEMATEAERLVAQGHKGLRLKIGPGSDVECVSAVREAVGDHVTIRVDCNQGYPKDQAIKVIRMLEGFNIELVEQPTVWWDFQGLAEVAASVDTPIMPHESIYLMSDVKSLIDMGAVGVLGLKTYRPAGGITNASMILGMAKMMNIPCLMHDDVELGVSLAAACQIIASHQKALTHTCELSGFPEWMSDDVVKNPVKFENGFFEVPEGPGLGVELDDSKIEKYAKGIISLKI